MHSRSCNVEFMSYDNDIVTELSKTILSRYQGNLETSLKGSDFIFDSVWLLYHKCHRINFWRGGSYIDFPDWIRKEKATIKTINKDNKCFKHAASVALNYREIESHPERVSNIKPFINKYNWKGINYPLKIDDSKTFEKNNPIIALNILYIKEKEKCSTYISKFNWNCEKQITILIIQNKEKEGLRKLSPLLHRITSKHDGYFFLLELPSFF